MKRWLDFVLGFIFIVCAALLFLAHEDPFARKAVYTYTGIRPIVPPAKALYKILYDLSVGAIITLAFYALVVRLPDYQRRQRLKDSLERQYKTFREDCIQIMLIVADGSYSAELPEMLIGQEAFRAYFRQKMPGGGDRWDEFYNKLDKRNLRDLLTRMETFRDEVTFVLNSTDVPKDEPLEFLKRLSAAIYSIQDVSIGYDKLNPLANLLWSLFAGWDQITGYRKEDIVQQMIEAI